MAADRAHAPLSGLSGQEPELRRMIDKIQDVINESGANRGQGLDQREAQLRNREARLDQQEADLRSREQAVVQREQAVAQREAQLNQAYPQAPAARALCQYCGYRVCTRGSDCYLPNGLDNHHHSCGVCHREWKTYGAKGAFGRGKGFGKF